jgi:hypothetical protein
MMEAADLWEASVLTLEKLYRILIWGIEKYNYSSLYVYLKITEESYLPLASENCDECTTLCR